ncbi:caskin-1 isoform X2 [Rhinoderma darwinii]|uniref:caskin-1 isoform X2 n=1 Tax=Rhinoderma darwinii TaxID=43563 RepID=UPI003F6706DF
MGKDQELLQAVKAEDLSMVQKLLQRPKAGKAKLLGSAKRVNVNFQDTDGFSALHHAALIGNTELISLLLEAQAAVDIKDNKGMRPLHYAAWQGKKEPMKLLLISGSAVNIQSDEGQIPLHQAAQHGHYDVSEMLLQHQSNPCIMDISGKTPLDLACEFGRVGVVQLLLNSNMCAALLEPKPGDSTDPNGTSPLHLAAKNGHIDIIRLLLQAGIDINRQTKSGTALHEAALCGKTEVVRLLLDSGINAHVRNTYNQSALDIVNQFTGTQASKEIKQMLRDASAALQVRALKDYCNNYDLTSLNIKMGDVITVLEQHPDGRWKGCIHDNRTGNDRVGYFPANLVEAISKRTGSRGSESSPSHLSPGHTSVAPTEEIWVLRKPFAGGDRSSMGSTGSATSGRSSGSGQSAGSAHAIPANAEGVKLLATVLSQKALGQEPGDACEGHTGSARPQSVASCPYIEQSYGDHPKKMEAMTEGKSAEAVFQWLCKFQLQLYAPNFINSGYDIPTISRMTPEDLTAIGVTKPGHRKKIFSEINSINIGEWLPDYKPANLSLWLSMIGLGQYYKVLVENGYENIDFITDITWEDLQEIGITKLGHQKKLMLAVKKLVEIQRSEYGKFDSGSMRRRPPQKNVDSMSIDSPPPDSAECQSPKMKTFQDSELSDELQAAMTSDTPDGSEKQMNHAPHHREGSYRGPSGARLHHEGSLSGRARHISSSQELLGDGSKGPSTTMSKSQEYLTEEVKREDVTRESRPLKQGHSIKRASVPPVPGKPRQSFPPSYTPPQTPTKGTPSSPQSVNTPQATAKVKPTPQLLPPSDRPMSPRSMPQSPTHRGFAYVLPQPIEGEGTPSHLAQAVPVLPVSVPVLCLPPAGSDGDDDDDDEDAQEGERGNHGRPKKRAHSLNRYAGSDGEKEELLVIDGGLYGTGQRRVGRSHSVRSQAGIDKNVNRSQSFAVRPRKKGPPPPPPKRSSSAISGTNLGDGLSADDATGEGYREQRRASDFGGIVDTGSAGSVKSIAAMLELSSIGGGPRAICGPRPRGSDGFCTHLLPHPASPELHRLPGTVAGVKHREAIGLEGEVVNRRRTISGPVTGLVSAARRERQEASRPPDSPRSPSDVIPFAEERKQTVKHRPRPSRTELAGSPTAEHVRHSDLASVESSVTLKRRGKARQGHHPADMKFLLTESDTVKRRPKPRDKDGGGGAEPLVVYQNGMGTIRRRPVSEMSVGRQDSSEHTVQTPERSIKPPVSPKPTIIHPSGKTPSTPTKKTQVMGHGGEVRKVMGTPPPVSPKPTPPPTAPKPIKPHAIIQSSSASSTPAPSPVKQPNNIKPSSTPPSLCSSPAKPLTPGHPLQVPIKPPRLSITSSSIEGGGSEAAQQKLEETSASLAAALQAVEEKIKQEDAQKDSSSVEEKSTVSILDDIGSMFDDLADQLDAMLE